MFYQILCTMVAGCKNMDRFHTIPLHSVQQSAPVRANNPSSGQISVCEFAPPPLPAAMFKEEKNCKVWRKIERGAQKYSPEIIRLTKLRRVPCDAAPGRMARRRRRHNTRNVWKVGANGNKRVVRYYNINIEGNLCNIKFRCDSRIIRGLEDFWFFKRSFCNNVLSFFLRLGLFFEKN